MGFSPARFCDEPLLTAVRFDRQRSSNACCRCLVIVLLNQTLTAAVAITALVFCCATPSAAVESEWVQRGTTGRLLYTPDAQGDRVPDFSDVGYRGGKAVLPTIGAAVTVQPGAGDDTTRIQNAITQAGNLPIGADGFRGAVVLGAGEFQIGGQLQINKSGVVLRGAGQEVAGGTVLRATGTSQRSLIEVAGSGSQSLTGSTRNLIDKTVPVGSRSFRVNSTSGFSVGDTVRVERPSPANWISDLGMDMIPPRSDGGTVNQWSPGSFNLRYDRVITRIEGDRVFVDAPLTNSFEQQYGGGTIRRYNWTDRIENVGVENLRAESDFASATDEAHSWNFVSIDDAQNVWVRDTTSANFARSAVLSNPGAKWVTVDSATNLTPKSQVTGGRRYSYDLSGQLELVTNSEANEGRHDFVNNSSRPAGPHVFHNSVANNALDEAGPHQRWATGTLFDNITVDGDQINARNRGNFGSGHGWAGANMVIWNSTAESYIVQNPPTAQNWLVGSVGELQEDTRFGVQPDAYVDSHGAPVEIDSLYEAQVADASDVQTFTWSGGTANWSDPSAWREQLAPGHYRVEPRDYLIGDIDDFVDDGSGSVDEAFIDPAWEASILGASALPVTGFDDTSGNNNVAFTIQHQLDPGERVIHGSLALSLKQAGGVIDTDFVRLFDTAPENKASFTELGWDTEIGPSEAFVGVIDLGGNLDDLQSGSINVQINDDTATDWALYTVTVASSAGASDTARVLIEGGGEATLDADVGSIAALTITDSGLHLTEDGRLNVLQQYVQSPAGVLSVTVGDAAGGRLNVDGTATLDGEIELRTASGYTPAFDDEFELLAAEQLTGVFATETLPGITGDLQWKLTQTIDAIVASVILAGDYNGDGSVGAADYTVWRDSFGSTTDLAADGDGNGVVNDDDRAFWAARYGSTAPTAAAIPEPASAGLLGAVLAVSAFSAGRRANFRQSN